MSPPLGSANAARCDSARVRYSPRPAPTSRAKAPRCFEAAAELAGRSVEAILRPMAYQTLECDRRGGLAARERREELSDPVPVVCDPIEVTRNLLAYKIRTILGATRQGFASPLRALDCCGPI